MSPSFQADNNVDPAIVDGVLRREPDIDFRTARSVGLDGVPDRKVLELAAQERRILVSCDKRTMFAEFYRFVAEGNNSPGVLIVIPQDAGIGRVIESVIFVWSFADPNRWANRATIIPFKSA